MDIKDYKQLRLWQLSFAVGGGFVDIGLVHGDLPSPDKYILAAIGTFMIIMSYFFGWFRAKKEAEQDTCSEKDK